MINDFIKQFLFVIAIMIIVVCFIVACGLALERFMAGDILGFTIMFIIIALMIVCYIQSQVRRK
jgi:hypothetical protein